MQHQVITIKFLEITNEEKHRILQEQVIITSVQEKTTGQQPTQNRYFKPNIRCFRCKQFGHYSSHCPDESIFCLNCLAQSHSIQNCPQKIVCFRCYQFGHIANNCDVHQGIYCKQCYRKHRDQCGFICKGDNSQGVFIIRDSRQLSNITCMTCQQKGHINCHNNNSQ